jgi:hypothetical protein
MYVFRGDNRGISNKCRKYSSQSNSHINRLNHSHSLMQIKTFLLLVKIIIDSLSAKMLIQAKKANKRTSIINHLLLYQLI